MIYRSLAGEKVSQLGFGAMRLPMAGAQVDTTEAIRMMHRAIEGGVNYIDTAWVYHNGTSEGIVGKAVKGGRRDKVFLATKSPIWEVKAEGDFTRLLDDQLLRLDTDRIDFYLLHALNAGSWQTCLKFNAIDFLEKAKKAGKIRHYGFSFHDAPEVFPTILNAHPWEFCQIQYNILDREPASGHPGLAAPRTHGTDIIIMEPLRGGNLAGRIPVEVQKLWDGAAARRSPAEWSLRWIWDKAEVGLVLSGMSTMEQLEENLAIAGTAAAGSLKPDELALVDRVTATYRALIKVGCTYCKYCMPCPSGVDIPRNLGIYNEHFMFAGNPGVKGGYQWIPAAERSDKCTQCGLCADKCPQRIDIPGLMPQVAATFA